MASTVLRSATLLLLTAAAGIAADPSQYVVPVTAVVTASPAQIALQWPTAAGSTGITVYRRIYGTTSGWGTPVATLGASATSFADSAVSAGTRYEYRVASSGSPYATGYQVCGIEVPLVDDRGIVELIVDASMATPLVGELIRLEDDLVGDGWTVNRHDVARTDAVTAVKALITADYDAAPTRVRSILLVGHVPVPYSGDIAPDGHGDHVGAWPADGYYANMDGAWTDSTVNDSGASRTENRNIPGDGKFDQSVIPGTEILPIGRVDLSNMPSFPIGETELLRRYLDKDHAWRTRAVTATARGLVDDNFGEFYGEAFAADGWGNFGELVGPANVSAGDFVSTLATDDYLFAYGCGGGWYQGAGGVGGTGDFNANPTKAVFTILFGSYFGDWDSGDNFLRAPLASAGLGLTCFWGGRPHWFMHPMGLGEPVGVAAKLALGSGYDYGSYPGVHCALMGDPTVRLHILRPPTALVATPGAGSVHLAWSASADAALGYHVYRSADDGPGQRLTTTPVTGTTYDDTVAPGAWRYLVKAVRRETTTSGTYINASTAAAAPATVTSGAVTGAPAAQGSGDDSSSCGMGAAAGAMFSLTLLAMYRRRS